MCWINRSPLEGLAFDAEEASAWFDAHKVSSGRRKLIASGVADEPGGRHGGQPPAGFGYPPDPAGSRRIPPAI
jgi:hypothetical protein